MFIIKFSLYLYNLLRIMVIRVKSTNKKTITQFFTKKIFIQKSTTRPQGVSSMITGFIR